jgi:regulatory protein
MLKIELRRKGVEPEIIDNVVEDVDEIDNALQAARKKARTLPVSDYKIFYQRLNGYLQRRGFNYRVINNAIKQVWQERTQNSQGDLEILKMPCLRSKRFCSRCKYIAIKGG